MKIVKNCEKTINHISLTKSHIFNDFKSIFTYSTYSTTTAINYLINKGKK